MGVMVMKQPIPLEQMKFGIITRTTHLWWEILPLCTGFNERFLNHKKKKQLAEWNEIERSKWTRKQFEVDWLIDRYEQSDIYIYIYIDIYIYIYAKLFERIEHSSSQ